MLPVAGFAASQIVWPTNRPFTQYDMPGIQAGQRACRPCRHPVCLRPPKSPYLQLLPNLLQHQAGWSFKSLRPGRRAADYVFLFVHADEELHCHNFHTKAGCADAKHCQWDGKMKFCIELQTFGQGHHCQGVDDNASCSVQKDCVWLSSGLCHSAGKGLCTDVYSEEDCLRVKCLWDGDQCHSNGEFLGQLAGD